MHKYLGIFLLLASQSPAASLQSSAQMGFGVERSEARASGSLFILGIDQVLEGSMLQFGLLTIGEGYNRERFRLSAGPRIGINFGKISSYFGFGFTSESYEGKISETQKSSESQRGHRYQWGWQFKRPLTPTNHLTFGGFHAYLKTKAFDNNASKGIWLSGVTLGLEFGRL